MLETIRPAHRSQVMAHRTETRDDHRMKHSVIALALLAGCTAQKWVPVTARANPNTIERASRSLVMHGYDVANQQPTIVTSAWKENCSIGDCYRVRWVISVSGETATLDNQCESKPKDPNIFNPDQWTPCGDYRPRGTAEEGATLATEIGGK